MQELKHRSCRAKIIYPGIEVRRKDGLSMQGLKPVRKSVYENLRIVFGLPEQGTKYNIPHLKGSLEAIFSEMIQANKKVFIFRQGNYKMNVLHLSLAKSFALSICSKDPMKNTTLGYFCKSTHSQMHHMLQP